jgi:hypothetical protein
LSKDNLNKMLVVLVVLVALAAAEASLGDHVVATIKGSVAYQTAAKRYRAQRVARGLTPDILPHSEYVRMRDGTLLWTTYWDPRLDPNDAVRMSASDSMGLGSSHFICSRRACARVFFIPSCFFFLGTKRFPLLSFS